MEDKKKIDIKEFREKGYLQEVNRRFFHPIGLALQVKREANGEEIIDGILDYRSDEKGVIYDLNKSDISRQEKFTKNSNFIDGEIKKRYESRINLFGHEIEPITNEIKPQIEIKMETTESVIKVEATGLKAEVLEDMKTAMKEKNTIKLEAIRAIKASFDKYEKENPGKEIDYVKALKPLVKQRTDSVEQFKIAGNTELATKEQTELDIINSYLIKVQPAQLSLEEIESIAKDFIASGITQIGQIMGAFKSKYEGRYDGKALSTLVKTLI